MERLPVSVGGLSPEVRRVCALSEISWLESEAARQESVKEYARQANAAVVEADADYERLPYAMDIAALAEKYYARAPAAPSPRDESERPTKLRDVVPVSSFSRDILSRLHPDRGGENVDFSEEIFKIVSDARSVGNNTHTQRLYIKGMHAVALNQANELTVEKLEIARYRSWIALGACAGRFRSIEEVDAWKNDLLMRMPYRKRGDNLVRLGRLFATSVGLASSSDYPNLPPEVRGSVADFIDAVCRVERTAESGKVPLETLQQADLGGFDERAPSAVRYVAHLLDLDRWDAARIVSVKSCSLYLRSVARTLDIRFDGV